MIGNIPLQETMGTINLKIAQLQRHLRVLEQQQFLSSPYPDYKAKLGQKIMLVQTQLDQLLQSRIVEQ